ncbi:hypothetical protein [Sphingopyxis terrae]|uniref:hypothetical protein n=1 Tax=Sphingopyxis terrae TaxID=33052 RepID=UPI0007879B00|nr:hypothetical protein [Sphingopyxis terrae]
MFITKKRHDEAMREAEEKAYAAWSNMATQRDDMRVERDGADQRLKDAMRQINGLRADVAAAEKAANEARVEIERLRPLAQKHPDKLARDRKRVRGGAKGAGK